MKKTPLNFLLAACFFASMLSVQAYPDPVIEQCKIVMWQEVQHVAVLPGQTAIVTVTFNGSNTGCALVVLDATEKHIITFLKHDLSKSPETLTTKFSNPTGNTATYVIAGFSYIGDPPLENHLPSGWIRDSGCHQVPQAMFDGHQHGDMEAGYVCHGSFHGPTTITDNVIISL